MFFCLVLNPLYAACIFTAACATSAQLRSGRSAVLAVFICCRVWKPLKAACILAAASATSASLRSGRSELDESQEES